jgi:hypothetical protein
MKITIYTSMMTGFIMSVIRAREPYFRFLIKQQWCSFFGIALDENDKHTSAQYVNDSLATFLTSSLNVELVHVILEAITKHTKSFVDPTVNHLNFKGATLAKDKSEFTIDTIMIKNPDKWKVAKLPDFLEQEFDTAATKHKGTIRLAKNSHGKLPSGKPEDPLLLKQMEAVDKTEEVLVINEDVKVTEYAPMAFAFLRRLDEIDHETVKASLNPVANRDSVFKAGESQGKSGSFFFFSHDKKFIIKTMTPSDFKTYNRLFDEYIQAVATRRHSLLARIYGIYKIEMEEVAPVHLILMGNTKKSNDANIVNIFDLKGSFVNREVVGKGLKNTATLKDINLLNLAKSNSSLLMFREEDRQELMENLERDIVMLRDKNIMDYSLLLAIEKNPEWRDPYALPGHSRTVASN